MINITGLQKYQVVLYKRKNKTYLCLNKMMIIMTLIVNQILRNQKNIKIHKRWKLFIKLDIFNGNAMRMLQMIK
jgi:hypothetical protein